MGPHNADDVIITNNWGSADNRSWEDIAVCFCCYLNSGNVFERSVPLAGRDIFVVKCSGITMDRITRIILHPLAEQHYREMVNQLCQRVPFPVVIADSRLAKQSAFLSHKSCKVPCVLVKNHKEDKESIHSMVRGVDFRPFRLTFSEFCIFKNAKNSTLYLKPIVEVSSRNLRDLTRFSQRMHSQNSTN